MLKDFVRIWSDGGLMQDVIAELAQMVADARYVYTHAWEVCIGQAVISTTKESVREHDRAVNRQERRVRRMLVEHLTINPGQDIAGCLAVMTMAKDLERIGDLAKDVFRLGVTLDGKGRELKYAERIDALQQDLGSTFPRLERAVRTSATEEVDEIFKVYSSVKSQCRALRDEVLADELPTREAAVTVLLLHVFSRINAHIGNAATGIVFPIEDIDFVSRGLRRAGKADSGTGTP